MRKLVELLPNSVFWSVPQRGVGENRKSRSILGIPMKSQSLQCVNFTCRKTSSNTTNWSLNEPREQRSRSLR